MIKKKKFPAPMEGSVFFEDPKVYACLAFHPVVEGHTIVVWKSDVEDLNELSSEEYFHFMTVVYKIRKVLMEIFETDKVYLVYLDEICHVHIHLFPRNPSDEKGFGLMTKPHSELKDLSKISDLKEKIMRYPLNGGSYGSPTFFVHEIKKMYLIYMDEVEHVHSFIIQA